MVDTARRNVQLRQMLMERRDELEGDVRRRILDGRTDRPREVGDDLEQTDAGSQGDLDGALLQMRAETLVLIGEALVRLDAGEYGLCVDCAEHISDRRLRALPFAVRCQACQQKREQAPMKRHDADSLLNRAGQR